MKLGGDKGHGSFKFNFQLMNTEHPNSQKSTTLVSVFKAGDSTTNLHTALDMYREHFQEMQGMKTKYVEKCNPTIQNFTNTTLTAMSIVDPAASGSSTLRCPMSPARVATTTISTALPPSLILSLLSDLVLYYNRCGKLVKTNEYTRHRAAVVRQPVLNTPTIQGDYEGRPDEASLHPSYSDGEESD